MTTIKITAVRVRVELIRLFRLRHLARFRQAPSEEAEGVGEVLRAVWDLVYSDVMRYSPTYNEAGDV